MLEQGWYCVGAGFDLTFNIIIATGVHASLRLHSLPLFHAVS